MKIQDVPFSTVEWDKIPPIEYKGETGTSWCKTVEQGNVRVRVVEYGAGYRANHWCDRGHVVFILNGEIDIEIENRKTYHLFSGMSFHVADGLDIHRAFSEKGAKVFIID
ncbi:MAG: DHCW motif cupin fold protein [Bacteroidota bacterium]